MALQGQGLDPSERIFVELRSKNDETKNKAATELRDLITLLSRGASCHLSPIADMLTLLKNGLPNASVPFTIGSPAASAASLSKPPIPATKSEEFSP